tara:strand:+ start:129 stop:302 length:174 start_codon:yes stop_codon:yes gene_type:complete
MTTEKIKILLLFLIFSMVLVGCNRTIEPSTTTIEYGTSENGKNKTTKSIKQSFKWSK